MKRLIQFISVLFIFGIMLPVCSTSVVNPDEIGVRRSLVSGVTQEDFGQGRVFDLPMYHQVYRLPKFLLYEHFGAAHGTALNLRTRDNNLIDVDVSIVYRITDGEGHKIIEEGLQDTYRLKVQSISKGFLNENLAELSNRDMMETAKREEFANVAVEAINRDLSQYHVKVIKGGVVLRAVRFKGKYEEKLQDKQLYQVKAKLDEAKRQESEAVTITDTKQKEIQKDQKLETEAWNNKIETQRSGFEIGIAEIAARALRYDRERRAAADALCQKAGADGQLAEAKAEALGKRLEAEALATPAGRTYSAIVAVQNFQLSENIQLNSLDPAFLSTFGSMGAWRRFFYGKTR